MNKKDNKIRNKEMFRNVPDKKEGTPLKPEFLRNVPPTKDDNPIKNQDTLLSYDQLCRLPYKTRLSLIIKVARSQNPVVIKLINAMMIKDKDDTMMLTTDELSRSVKEDAGKIRNALSFLDKYKIVNRIKVSKLVIWSLNIDDRHMKGNN